MFCGCHRARRSIGLEMISETLLRLDSSLGPSWLETLGREVRCGEALGFLHSQRR